LKHDIDNQFFINVYWFAAFLANQTGTGATATDQLREENHVVVSKSTSDDSQLIWETMIQLFEIEVSRTGSDSE
jgi:hypothetical protein